eukprot:CAMPEP_0173108338 /NCGR_PEP_ID=MMETSP1102-20130122/42606_1 /TAXON_ID=49646 /ORGANISM="Geminigera sp., Strain Caron Lab Isolate" /LENGTH=313 /DNA_ID=CAMNT_0014006685 /DNA_START=78 /DNA_END=1019 /DNA_ORIENTATION=+
MEWPGRTESGTFASVQEQQKMLSALLARHAVGLQQPQCGAWMLQALPVLMSAAPRQYQQDSSQDLTLAKRHVVTREQDPSEMASCQRSVLAGLSLEIPQHTTVPQTSFSGQAQLGQTVDTSHRESKLTAVTSKSRTESSVSEQEDTGDSDDKDIDRVSKSNSVNTIWPRRKRGNLKRTTSEPVFLDEATVSQYFTIPLHKAAVKIGISPTAMKSACRRMGILKWPYRSLAVSNKAKGGRLAVNSPLKPKTVPHPPVNMKQDALSLTETIRLLHEDRPLPHPALLGQGIRKDILPADFLAASTRVPGSVASLLN